SNSILQLSEPIHFNNNQKSVPLPLSRPPVSRNQAVVSAWGKMSDHDDVSNILQYLYLNIIDLKECQKYHDLDVSSSAICTFNKVGAGLCNGDSGSPLVFNGRVVGVVSRGIPCARGIPDVFTSVYDTLSFVKSLADPVTENSNQKILHVATQDPPVGAELRLTGWGRTTTSGTGPLPDNLQTTTVRLLSNQECQSKVGQYPIGKGHMCTFRQKGIGACFGDSGGPLVYNNQLVGVVSWVFPCAQGLPDAFTRASQYTSFINQVINKT
ncbi:chymotrypsin-2-like, partial [Ceratina calcarata]|uniref:Chymotrypsin-2-like n=1 Tax=Ceratina calcarata TaxID=156304 RepID=A0AAJ7RYE9_9HYME